MVTGGTLGLWQAGGGYIDTSEVYDSDLGSWAISGAKLPQPMLGMIATNIDGRVLIFGNCIIFTITRYQRNIIIAGGIDYDGNYYDYDILEFKADDDTIVTLGHMTEERSHHAISVVQTQDYSNWCN